MRGVFSCSGLSILLIAASIEASQEIHLAGEQDGYYERGRYLVWKNVVVERGKALTFAPGSIVRFRHLAGIEVRGTLKCLGTADKPIILTSDNDRFEDSEDKDSPRPFDWNGVKASDSSARIVFGHVRLLYSTYGLDVAHEASVELLDSVVFAGNGRQNLSIGGEPVPVEDAKPFSWGRTPGEGVAVRRVEAAAAESPAPSAGPPEPTAATPPSGAWRTPVRLALGGIAVAGGTVAVVAHGRWRERYREYQDLSLASGDTEESIAVKQRRLDRLQEDAIRLRRVGIAGTVIAAIGAVGFGVTFFF